MDQDDTNNHFDRFDKMVVKVTETKTVADSLWQGYNVSPSLSKFSKVATNFWERATSIFIVARIKYEHFFGMSQILLICCQLESIMGYKPRYAKDEMLNF